MCSDIIAVTISEKLWNENYAIFAIKWSKCSRNYINRVNGYNEGHTKISDTCVSLCRIGIRSGFMCGVLVGVQIHK